MFYVDLKNEPLFFELLKLVMKRMVLRKTRENAFPYAGSGKTRDFLKDVLCLVEPPMP